jgi:hypothetical protein
MATHCAGGQVIEVTLRSQDSEWSCYCSDGTTPGQWVVMLLKWRYKASTVSGHVIEVTLQSQHSEWSCYWSDVTTPGQWVVMLLKWRYNARTVSGHVIEVTLQSQHSGFVTSLQSRDRSLSWRCTITSIPCPLTVLALYSHFNNMTTHCPGIVQSLQ